MPRGRCHRVASKLEKLRCVLFAEVTGKRLDMSDAWVGDLTRGDLLDGPVRDSGRIRNARPSAFRGLQLVDDEVV